MRVWNLIVGLLVLITLCLTQTPMAQPDPGRVAPQPIGPFLDGALPSLIPGTTPTATPQPPDQLSSTNAFVDLTTLAIHPGCIPYDLNVPFWSDGAIKHRWMCLPNDGLHDTPDEQIDFFEQEEWRFPVGTVLIKHFELPIDETDPSQTVRLETRFIVHAEDGYYGVSYKWQPNGEDAQRLLSGEEISLEIKTASGTQEQRWTFPGQAQCSRCHNSAAGYVLGPKTRQLNRLLHYPSTGRNANQLLTLNHLGIFSPPLDPELVHSVLTAAPSADLTQGLSKRARSYLDANCSYCHRPGGVRANFDARLTTPLASQGLINGVVNRPLGIPNAVEVAPGSHERSVLWHRLISLDFTAMPPLAKNRVDPTGIDLIEAWIYQLDSLTLGNMTHMDGTFIDTHHPSLYINLSDTFTVNAPHPVAAAEVQFYARQLGNPITPFIVRVEPTGDFTVLAIGTTRIHDYRIGENILAFDNTGPRPLAVTLGNKLAIGFIDALADGQGWGAGTVIPATTNETADSLWALLPQPLILEADGFVNGVETPRLVEGETLQASNVGSALQVITTLKRSYHFAVTLTFTDTLPAPSVTPQIQNGSFEQDLTDATRQGVTTSLSGWTVTAGDVELIPSDVALPTEGSQSLDLNGTQAGAIAQTLHGLRPHQPYTVFVDYANLHRLDPSTGSATAEIWINKQRLGTIQPTTDTPQFITNAGFEFIAPTSGQATLALISTTSGSEGIVVDNIRLQSGATQPDILNTNDIDLWIAPQHTSDNGTVEILIRQ